MFIEIVATEDSSNSGDYRVGLNDILSKDAIQMQGEWCVLTLLVELNKSKAVKRICFQIENQHHQTAEVTICPRSDEFTLLSIEVSLKDAFLGPVLIQSASKTEDLIQYEIASNPLSLASHAQSDSRKLVYLEPSMLLSSKTLQIDKFLSIGAARENFPLKKKKADLKSALSVSSSHLLPSVSLKSKTELSLVQVSSLRESFCFLGGPSYLAPLIDSLTDKDSLLFGN